MKIAEWAVWTVFTVFFTVQWSYQLRRAVRIGKPPMIQTMLLAFYWWVISIAFLFTNANKLHILWLVPACFLMNVIVGFTPVGRTIGLWFGSILCLGAHQPSLDSKIE